MATTGNDNDTVQDIPMDPVNLEEEGNIPTILLSVLSARQENLTSSNAMFQDLVEKKRNSTETDSISKRAKRDARKSRCSVNASEKALTSTSKVIDTASEEASDSASEKTNMKAPDDDTLSLLGDDNQHDLCSEDEEVKNDDLLSQITSLSSSDDTGPPMSDNLSKLVNDKFQTEYTVEKHRDTTEIQSTK